MVFRSGRLAWFSFKSLVPLQSAAASEAVTPLPEPAGQVALPSQPHTPTVVLHPATYLNKVVVTDDGGKWHVVNIATNKVLYSAALCGTTPITAAAQSPAVDVLAFGLADGTVAVHNIRADARVVTFTHSAEESVAAARAAGGRTAARAAAGGDEATSPNVTALAFCTSKAAKAPLLLSATGGGCVALWDLKAKELFHVDVAAHGGAVTTAAFLPSQPVFVTAGADNALTVWLLDNTDGRPRRLRERSGHGAAITAARFFGGGTVATLVDGADASVAEMVTAGRDRNVRVTHTLLAHQCRELSQGNLEKRARELGLSRASQRLRLAPVTAMALNERNVGDWSNVVTAHEGLTSAYAWSWYRKALDTLVLPTPDVTPEAMGSSVARPNTVSAVEISACGHFALVGGSCGTITRFALQNGAPVGEYPRGSQRDGRVALRGRKRRRGELLGSQLPRADRDVGKGGSGLGPLGVSGSVLGSLRKVFGAESTLSGPELQAKSKKPTPGAAGLTDGMLQSGSLTAVKGTASVSGSGGVAADTLAHAGAVRGLAVDERNAWLVSGGADGMLRWWDLTRHTLATTVRVGAPIARMECHRASGLLVLATDSFDVYVFDIGTRRRVRSLRGHKAPVLALAFSQDGRWVASSDVRGHLRVWDVATGRCVDWLQFRTPAVTVNFAPTGEFMATSHTSSPGLSLWLNRAHYSWVPTDAVPTAPVSVDQPAVLAEEAGGAVRAGQADAAAGEQPGKRPGAGEDGSDEEAVPAGAAGTMVLSGAPPSHWVNLDKLAVIAERNKPVEAVKDKEAAPFFLPTVAGLAPGFDTATPPPRPESGSRILTSLSRTTEEQGEAKGGGAVEFNRPLTSAFLRQCDAIVQGMRPTPSGAAAADSDSDSEEEDEVLVPIASEGPRMPHAARSACKALAELLRTAPPSAVDADLRSICLGEEDNQGQRLLAGLLRYFAWQLGRLAHYDLVQAQLSVVLQEYSGLLQTAVAVAEETGTAEAPAKAPRSSAADKSASATAASPSMRMLASAATDLLVVQQHASARVADMQSHALSLVMYLSNLQ